MYRTLRALLLVVGLATPAAVVAAEITFYEHDAYRGRSFSSIQTIPNFADIGFNDRASSVIVRSGTWQICSDAFFRGRCVTLSRGEYPTLRSMDLNDLVSSARDMEWLGGGGGGPGGGAGVPVQLFEGRQFDGRGVPVNGTITNFSDIGFNDRAQSMIVRIGLWEACENADFRGTCQTYGPGHYPDLGGLARRISSIRPVAGDPVRGGWGTGSRALLYEGSNLSGRSFLINTEVVSNLASTGFNDRAASLRIEGGYWIFCSDANFEGECLTFGPGDYPALPWGLNHRISSGRRVQGNYPYNQRPAWPR